MKINNKIKNKNVGWQKIKIGGGLLAGLLAPSAGWACACGCGVFDVGGTSMLPTDAGGMAYAEYDFQDQNRNWSGTSTAPAANNGDKELKTDFMDIGVQYLFNRSWGVQMELPYDYRTFKTETGLGPTGVSTIKWDSAGDLRVHGLYTGFSDDLSSGVDFGLKLPTGNFTYDSAYVDRDSELGTGSTDLLLGGFKRGNITSDGKWDWFVQGELDVPVLVQDDYRPGVEFDSDAGVDFKGFSLGRLHISPLAQLIFSTRTSDTGSNASGGANDDPEDGVSSGYERLMVSPGLEFHLHPVKIYMDAEVPIFQNFTGNQLAAPVLFKIAVSYMF